jgi:thioesterase domain-containing protein
MATLCSSLQEIWNTEIPITKAMGIEVCTFDNNALFIRAELAPNVNVHGTAFAGSLYAVAALCGWGATHLSLVQAQRPASIVIARGEIDYARPVDGTIEARCTFVDTASLHELGPGDKRRFELVVQIGKPSKPGATFRGSYAIRLPRDF